MRISYRHRFLFVHVDRTGGTSISRALDPFSYRQGDAARILAAFLRRAGFEPEYYKWRRFRTQHLTAAEIKAWLPESVFNRLFKFGFVRNPWDWLVSIYHARLQHPVHPEYELVKHLGSFREYVFWWKDNRSMQQRDYLFAEDGAPLVDFIGRFENLEDDFTAVCRRIGIRTALHHQNSAVARRQRSYAGYYDDVTRAIVERHFHKDITTFGYEFAPAVPDSVNGGATA